MPSKNSDMKSSPEHRENTGTDYSSDGSMDSPSRGKSNPAGLKPGEVMKKVSKKKPDHRRNN